MFQDYLQGGSDRKLVFCLMLNLENQKQNCLFLCLSNLNGFSSEIPAGFFFLSFLYCDSYENCYSLCFCRPFRDCLDLPVSARIVSRWVFYGHQTLVIMEHPALRLSHVSSLKRENG